MSYLPHILLLHNFLAVHDIYTMSKAGKTCGIALYTYALRGVYVHSSMLNDTAYGCSLCHRKHTVVVKQFIVLGLASTNGNVV